MLSVRQCELAWKWAGLAYLNNKLSGIGLEYMTLKEGKVKIDYNNYWVHLNGIEYDSAPAHLTITPGPGTETNWIYFHFSPILAGSKHAFYELLDAPKQQVTDPALYIQRSKKTCDKDKTLINRTESKTSTDDLPTSIDADINKLIAHIAKTKKGV